MRIIKYILLLILLISIGITVFIATQKATYDVTHTKIIKTPKIIVYNYINDYKNWETFCSWLKEDPSLSINYSEIATGKGAWCKWQGANGTGNLKTIFAKESDTISQQMIVDGETTNVSWKFTNVAGGTKVEWRNKGKVDLKSKFLAFFQGGLNNVVSSQYEKSLDNLEKTLVYEINTYSINVDGIVNEKERFYLKQSNVCEEKNLTKNIKIMLPKLKQYFTKNNIAINGKPFIMYNNYDNANHIVDFSVCIPVRDTIVPLPNSKVEFIIQKPYTAVKTTLKGDYSHTQQAWNKAFNYMLENKIYRNNTQQIFEVYNKSWDDVKSASKYVTTIYIPIWAKPVAKKPVYKKPSSSPVVNSPQEAAPQPAPTTPSTENP